MAKPKNNTGFNFDNLTAEETARLSKFIADPVTWGEVLLRNRNGTARKLWKHQKEDLRDQHSNIVHQDGRDVGKSICIVTDMLHYGCTVQHGSGLVATPHQGHLDLLFQEVEFQLEADPFLQKAVAVKTTGHPKIKHKPYYDITFFTGTQILFRPAGDYGKTFRGPHVDRIWVDEAAWIPELAWQALWSCLNDGGRIKIYSNPNGMRDTTYYRITNENTGRWKVYHWPSSINPNWSKKREREKIDFYGGIETAGYQHEVLGIHGQPTYGAFNAEQFRKCMIEIVEYEAKKITGHDLRGTESEEELRNRLIELLDLETCRGNFWVGADLGYTNDPAEITVWKEAGDGDNDRKTMRLVYRLHTKHVSYPTLSEIVALIDYFFNPVGIGIDNGGNGLSVTQELKELDKFKGRDFDEKVMSFDFGGTTIVGYSEEGQPIKKRTKRYMTDLINRALSKNRVEFPENDIDIENEFTMHTYHNSNSGRIIYSKGNDHIIDSARCAFLRREYMRLNELEPDMIEVCLIPVITNPIFE